MNESGAQPLYEKIFSLRTLHSMLRGITMPAWFLSLRAPGEGGNKYEEKDESIRRNIAQNLNECVHQAGSLGLDETNFRLKLEADVAALYSGDTTADGASAILQAEDELLQLQIQAIPCSLGKARDALRAMLTGEATDSHQEYDAYVLLSEEVLPGTIQSILRNWREAVAKEISRDPLRLAHPELLRQTFWRSRDFHEYEDSISHLRFYNHFNIGGFDNIFNDAAEEIATLLTDGTQRPADAYHLWLASRIPKPSTMLLNAIRVATDRAVRDQKADGSWSYFGYEVHTVQMTAYFSTALLKLAESESHRRRGVEGARWLLNRQNPAESWDGVLVGKEGQQHVVGTMEVSLLAIEAIARSGLPNVDLVIQAGRDWVMNQQNSFGMWDDEQDFLLNTVLVIELENYLDARARYRTLTSPYFQMGRDFLLRSRRLSHEDSPSSYCLAIVCVFHGLEFLLYGLLTLPSINFNVFQSPHQTVGFRAALKALEAHLQGSGSLAGGASVQYRSSLDRLAHLRDEVIHRGLTVTQADCEPLVNDALSFTSLYSHQVAGADVLL